MDQIELRGLRLTAVVGVLPEERERPQPLELDVVVGCDLTGAGRSDALGDTVDYGALCTVVEEVVTGSAPLLLERMAALVAEGVLAADGRIRWVEVVVRKLRPPVAQDLASSGVRVRRGVDR